MATSRESDNTLDSLGRPRRAELLRAPTRSTSQTAQHRWSPRLCRAPHLAPDKTVGALLAEDRPRRTSGTHLTKPSVEWGSLHMRLHRCACTKIDPPQQTGDTNSDLAQAISASARALDGHYRRKDIVEEGRPTQARAPHHSQARFSSSPTDGDHTARPARMPRESPGPRPAPAKKEAMSPPTPPFADLQLLQRTMYRSAATDAEPRSQARHRSRFFSPEQR